MVSLHFDPLLVYGLELVDSDLDEPRLEFLHEINDELFRRKHFYFFSEQMEGRGFLFIHSSLDLVGQVPDGHEIMAVQLKQVCSIHHWNTLYSTPVCKC